MKREKTEWEKIIGHNIRNDTYLVLERIQGNETYTEIINDLNDNRDKYNIDKYCPLVKIKTIQNYLSLIGKEIKQNEKDIQTEKERSKIRESLNTTGGIYGIYEDDKIIYIGQTKNFWHRFGCHKSCFNDKENKSFLYSYMRKSKELGHNLRIQPIISIKNMKVKQQITTRDLKAMELAFITLYQPICNFQGVKVPYEFTGK